jgi:F-type H+-transporting ATPase subunit b
MRLRTVALVAAIGGAALVAVAPTTAGAAGESVGACLVEKFHEAEEQGLEGTELEERIDSQSEDCLEAPNPILPATNEIIWGSISFVLLMAVLWKWGVPAIKKGMNDRTERIRSDLEAAEHARLAAEAERADVEAQLRDARVEAGRIIDEARGQADGVRAELQRRAEADIAEMRARAETEVNAARAAAEADVRREVASLALGAAEVVVGRQLQDQDTQIQLIEDYINRVGIQPQS